jgi:crotonobetainyl-CoA:carnitine CoA-transferase CaiB-like acyl-CoA transferase
MAAAVSVAAALATVVEHDAQGVASVVEVPADEATGAAAGVTFCQYAASGTGPAPFVVSEPDADPPARAASGVPSRKKRPSPAKAAARSHVKNVLLIASAPPRATPPTGFEATLDREKSQSGYGGT